MGLSGSKSGKLIDEAGFACRMTLPQGAMPAADHAYDLRTLQNRGGRFHRLEAACRLDYTLERTMNLFKDVTQIFRDAVFDALRQQTLVLQAQDCLKVQRQFIRCGDDGG